MNKTKNLFQILQRNKITPNQYYTLFYIRNKEFPNNVNIHQELRLLLEGGWINDYITESTITLKLTDKAESLLKQVHDKIETEPIKNESVKLTLEMCTEYLNIFPPIKLPSGKYARSHVNHIHNAFKWFFDNHKEYNWETIIKSTKRYVNEYQMENYKFMRTSQFFIRKQASDKTWESELSNYCELSLKGEECISSHFSDKVV